MDVLDIERRLDLLTRAGRGPLIAAVVALIAALPGFFAMPVIDRSEAVSAQAAAQMVDVGDLAVTHFQDAPRLGEPVGAVWLQALSARLSPEAARRAIQPYRIPSLLGAMLAAAACAWGASLAFGNRLGLAAGAMLGAGLSLSTAGFLATPDALFCGGLTLAMAALGRFYIRTSRAEPTGVRTKAFFWLGLTLAMTVKGLLAIAVVATALVALALWDRRSTWLKGLGWGWGLLLMLAVAGPWGVAATIATDGDYWTGFVLRGPMAPPGAHLAAAPLMLFPATFLLPAAGAWAWRERARPEARFAICWLVPAWIAFAINPFKLPYDTLPLYGAAAWMAAGALAGPIGPKARLAGLALQALAAAALAVAAVWIARLFGGGEAMTWALAAGAFALIAAAAAVWALKGGAGRALTAALAAGVAGHAVLAAGLLPGLSPLWVSQRASAALGAAGVDPRDGATLGPVAVAGYAEPSLVFELGTYTQLTDAEGAAAALIEGRPAFVSAAARPELERLLREHQIAAEPAGRVTGWNYAGGDGADLTLYRSLQTSWDEAP